MNIIVPLKLVPDLVDELSIDADGKSLDMTWMRLLLNEFDDHALEQAILLKEAHDAIVTVLVPDLDGAEDVLYLAAAKGADRLVKLGGIEQYHNNHSLARGLAPLVRDMQPDLILTGVQAHDDLDGPLGALLASALELPYIGYVAGVRLEHGQASVKKEFPGGLGARLQMQLPGVLGIQASQTPPRYVAFSRIRAAMSTAEIENIELEAVDSSGAFEVRRMYQPEVASRAQMLSGNPEEVAGRLVEVLQEAGVL